MPALPRGLSFNESPWVILALHTLFSSYGVFSQLQASKEGQQAAEEVAKLWASGNDIDSAHAKRLGGEVLEAVLRTQLGVFFTANLMAGCYAGFTLATKALFLGQLSASETSKLSERLLKFAMLKVVFLATVRYPSYGDLMQWLGWFAVMCYFSMFTELASLRGDALLSSPSATLAQHGRILLLLGGILAQDVSWLGSYWRSTAGTTSSGSYYALLWLFDPLFVAVDAAYSLVKYAVHALEHWQGAAAEARGQEREPWEGRTALVYWLDLSAELTLNCMTLAHYCHLWWLHGLQVQLIDGVLFLDVRFMLAAIRRRVRGHLRYRRLQHQLRHSFPDADEQQLAEDPCPICFERMKAGKQLPCSHVMHVSCLCAWLQQSRAGSFTCPLCRANLDIQPLQQQPRRRDVWLQGMGGAAHRLMQVPLALVPDAVLHVAQPPLPGPGTGGGAAPLPSGRSSGSGSRRRQLPGSFQAGFDQQDGQLQAAPIQELVQHYQQLQCHHRFQFAGSPAAEGHLMRLSGPPLGPAQAGSSAAHSIRSHSLQDMTDTQLPASTPDVGASAATTSQRVTTRLQTRLAAAAAAAAAEAAGVSVATPHNTE